MKKKTLCTILAIALTATMFSSCGNKNTPTENINNSVNSTPSVSSEQDTTTSAPSEIEKTESNTTTEVSSEQPESNTSSEIENTKNSTLSDLLSDIIQDIVSSVSSEKPNDTTSSEEPTVSEPSASSEAEQPVVSKPSEPVVSKPEPITSTPEPIVSPPEKPKIVAVSSIKLSSTSLSLTTGQTSTLTVTITPSNATDKTIKWSSSNTSVATVSNGKVTAKKAGTAIITATASNGKTATCTVTVKEKIINTVQPTDLTIYKTFYNYYDDKNSIYVGKNFETKAVTSCEINLGNNETLTATVTPSNATNKTVKWTSSNTSVATIDSNGKVTTKKQGVTVITATASNGISTTCTLTVTECHPYDKYETLVNGYYWDINAIKQDMIDYIKSLGINYVEMTLDEGSWSVPSSFYGNSIATKAVDFNEEECERIKFRMYDRIDSELTYLAMTHPNVDNIAQYAEFCPYIYEDPNHKGEIMVTVIYR